MSTHQSSSSRSEVLRILLPISVVIVVWGSIAAASELLSSLPSRIENVNPWKTILEKENDLIPSRSLTLPACLLLPYPYFSGMVFRTIPLLWHTLTYVAVWWELDVISFKADGLNDWYWIVWQQGGRALGLRIIYCLLFHSLGGHCTRWLNCWFGQMWF